MQWPASSPGATSSRTSPVLALAPVQKYREFSAVGPLVGHQRVSLKHGFEPPGDVTGLVPDACEMLQVAADLALVPGDQDGLNVGKVLIQRRPPDAGLRGDLRHRPRRPSPCRPPPRLALLSGQRSRHPTQSRYRALLRQPG